MTMGEAEQDQPTDDVVVPTECSLCGTALESAAVGHLLPSEAERADHDAGAVLFTDFCPNPECPGKATDGPTEAADPNSKRL